MAINPINLSPYSQSPLLSALDAGQKMLSLGAQLPLLHAQANYYNSRALSPSSTTPAALQLFQAYQNAPVNSPQKAYIGALLNKQMQSGSGLSVTMGPQGQLSGITTGQSQPSGLGSFTAQGLKPAPVPAAQASVIPGTSSRYGRGGSFALPSDGTNTTVAQAQTNAAATQNQQRVGNEAESHLLTPVVTNSLGQMNSATGWIPELMSLGKYYFGNPAQQAQAKTDLTNYRSGQMLLNDLSLVNAGLAGATQRGPTMLKEIRGAIAPYASHFADALIPSDVNAGAMGQTSQTMRKAANVAATTGITGYPVQVPTNQLWYQGGSPTPINANDNTSSPASANSASTATSMANPGPMGSSDDRLAQYSQVLGAINKKMFSQGLPNYNPNSGGIL